MMTKRYMLFTGDDYYPSGGMEDYRASYDTMLELVNNIGPCDWWNVYDTATDTKLTSDQYNLRYMGIDARIEWATDYDTAEVKGATVQLDEKSPENIRAILNNRVVKDLVEYAGFYVDVLDFDAIDPDNIRIATFTESIIRECVSLFEDGDNTRGLTDCQVKSTILKHFGLV